MSWTQVLDGYQPFKTSAAGATLPGVLPGPSQFLVTIWEVKETSSVAKKTVAQQTVLSENFSLQHLKHRARVRIIFAPVDHVLERYSRGIRELCDALSIPPEFLTERLQDVCHSFGTRTDERGFAAWFHYLCKSVRKHISHDWHKYGFFLRKDANGDVTLVCFGVSTAVRHRLEQFLEAKAWDDVAAQPLALFDLVLAGLYTEVDTIVWDLLDIISGLEARVLASADPRISDSRYEIINFSELHNWAKNLIYLGEVVESCLLVVDGALSHVEDRGNHATDQASMQLKECFQYRHSLFRSTKLRIGSLSKRVDNTITLAFNLVTLQDSQVMVRDSTSTAIISFVTVVFLPTTAVAAVIGSQLFVTERSEADGTVSTSPSPLFSMLWWIAIPLTLFTTGFAFYFRRSAVPHQPFILSRSMRRLGATMSVRSPKPPRNQTAYEQHGPMGCELESSTKLDDISIA